MTMRILTVLLLCLTLPGCAALHAQPLNCLIHALMGAVAYSGAAEVTGSDDAGVGAAVAVGVGKEIIDPVFTPIDVICTVGGGFAARGYRKPVEPAK